MRTRLEPKNVELCLPTKPLFNKVFEKALHDGNFYVNIDWGLSLDYSNDQAIVSPTVKAIELVAVNIFIVINKYYNNKFTNHTIECDKLFIEPKKIAIHIEDIELKEIMFDV